MYILICNFLMVNLIFMYTLTLLNSVKFLHILGHAEYIVLKCLKTCDRLKACSIAFPALDAGGLNFPHDIAAYIIVNTLESHLKSNCTATNIKIIKLMVYMEDAYRLYTNFHKLLPRIPDDNTETQPTNIFKGTLFA